MTFIQKVEIFTQLRLDISKMILENKIAVVYAGARGIGRSYVEHLLEKGVKVCFGDVLVEESKLLETMLQMKYGGDHVTFKNCDVTSDQQVEDLYLHATSIFGTVDIVVANAGIINENDWKLTMDINFGGIVRAFNSTLRHMSLDHGGKGGAFVATCSQVGFMASEFLPAYTASKHAIVGFLRSWAHPANYSSHGIRINSICPALVQTEILKNMMPEHHSRETLLNEGHRNIAGQLLNSVPQEMMLKPEDIASALIRLLEDDSLNGKFRIVESGSTDDVVFLMEFNVPKYHTPKLD